MKLVLFAFFIATAVALPNGRMFTKVKDQLYRKGEPRIISGQPARVGQFPFQVALEAYGPGIGWFCGGSLIHPEWVLTAAHCADGATNFYIMAGGITLGLIEIGRVEVEATEYYIHEEYDSYLLINDIALIKLTEPLKISNRIKPIKLPTRGNVVGNPVNLTVSGYGKTSDSEIWVSDKLNYVDLRTISNKECEDVYGPSIIESIICCRGFPEHSTCNGDSGGPLFAFEDGEPVHVGVVSFVHILGCASGNPSGYTRTESMLDWIEEKTGILIG